jgi:hypothetical protein
MPSRKDRERADEVHFAHKAVDLVRQDGKLAAKLNELRLAGKSWRVIYSLLCALAAQPIGEAIVSEVDDALGFEQSGDDVVRMPVCPALFGKDLAMHHAADALIHELALATAQMHAVEDLPRGQRSLPQDVDYVLVSGSIKASVIPPTWSGVLRWR